MSETQFSSLTLKPELLDNLSSLGFEEMTPIQGQSLPQVLAGADVIAQAKTGSGKTAAFGLGILQRLHVPNRNVQALVLCPTRELADQVSKAMRQFARMLPNVKISTICGGMPFRPQVASLAHGAHVIVGTPGRVAKHLRKKSLELNDVSVLVLDEGDRMLEMGFQNELDAILEKLPVRRQTLLFSATYPPEIQAIADRIMRHPVLVQADVAHDEADIRQRFYTVGTDPADRLTAVRLLLMEHQPESTVIFCNTKIETQEVSDALAKHGFRTLALHGDLEQKDRDETLVRFANKSVSVLVGTDVAARGLDIDGIDAVINYHVSRDFEVHVHRIGRTGRAGNKGIACSLFSAKEHHKISLLQEYLGQTIESERLPEPYVLDAPIVDAPMVSLKIKIGKKQKFRPGNILGALTGKGGLSGDQVGKIHIFDHHSYVAVTRAVTDAAIKKLSEERWKDRPIRAAKVEGSPGIRPENPWGV